MWSLFYLIYVQHNYHQASTGNERKTGCPSIANRKYSIVSFPNIFRKENVLLYAKKEWEQLSGSVKARAAFAIFRDAIEKKQLYPGKILLDATSGNTGIAYARIGKILGIPVSLCLPENASSERKSILRKLGVELILTSRFEGTDGAQEIARSLAEKSPELYFYADQYKNENNWKAHFDGTAVEILNEVPAYYTFCYRAWNNREFCWNRQKT